MADLLADTPFLDWLPVREIELQPLLPVAEWLCVMLGLLIPCLLGFCIIRKVDRRAWFLLGCALLASGRYGTQRRLELWARSMPGLGSVRRSKRR